MDIKERVKDSRRQKDRIAITIDRNLNNQLKAYKKRMKIGQLSPVINIMLWDWLKDQDEIKELENEKEKSQ